MKALGDVLPMSFEAKSSLSLSLPAPQPSVCVCVCLSVFESLGQSHNLYILLGLVCNYEEYVILLLAWI